MTVYPDGEALSERELRILAQLERDIEFDDEVRSVDDHLAPFHLVALYVFVAEVALAFAAYVSMVALTTMASRMWTSTIHETQAATRRLTTS